MLEKRPPPGKFTNNERGNVGITAAFSLVQMLLLGVLISFTTWLTRSAAAPTAVAQTGGIARSG